MRWRPEWTRYIIAVAVVAAVLWFGWQDRSRQIEALQERDAAQQRANIELAVEVARNAELARLLEIQVRALGEVPVALPTLGGGEPEEQEPEVQDPERQDTEPDDPEVQDPEVDDPDPDDPEIQDPEIQDPEVDDPSVPGPPGQPGPAGPFCPPGFSAVELPFNSPGGQRIILVCVAN